MLGPMPDPVDLRSDTVTHPTPEMRRAMAEAELGDDVFGDDPTVIALEERAAELTGKEAAVFVASGTMGNLVSHMAHVPRGGEIVASAGAHVVELEAGGHAVITGATVRQIPADAHGHMDLAALRAARSNPDDYHQPPTALVMLENTHSPSMGQPLSPAYTAEVARVAHELGVPLHVDGARLWNAVVALGSSGVEMLHDVDSATFCLSKGLSCPVGSVVVGDRAFVGRARRARKIVGGGMRQVGVLAAPGLVALRDGQAGMIERLADDHANARRLAEGLAELGAIDLDPSRVTTNYVVFGLRIPPGRDALAMRAAFLAEAGRLGVRYIAYPPAKVRALTHHGIDADDIERALITTRRAAANVGLAAAAA